MSAAADGVIAGEVSRLESELTGIEKQMIDLQEKATKSKAILEYVKGLEKRFSNTDKRKNPTMTPARKASLAKANEARKLKKTAAASSQPPKE